MICPKCGFKNTTGANFCGKCDKNLENHRSSNGLKFLENSASSSTKKFLLPFNFKNKTSVLLKSLILMVAVVGIFGIVNAHPISASHLTHSSQVGAVQNGTVYIESGFSGVVKVKNPITHKTVNVTVNYQPYSTGSGSIITKNGYIITAFHVVSDSNTLNKKNKLKKMSSGDVKWYVEEIGLMKYITANPQLSSRFLKNMSNQNPEKSMGQVTDKFIKNGWISAKSYKSNIYVKGLGLKGNGTNGSLKARLVDVGNSNKDQDIALLKVNPDKGKKLPALAVSAKNPKIGGKISIYGYPGKKMQARLNSNGKIKHSSSKSSDYTPFVSSGRLIAKEPNAHGTIYYRTSAVTAEGYSGGPVVNSENRVTGVLIYGIGAKKNPEKMVASLYLSSKYIKEICNKNKVPITVA